MAEPFLAELRLFSFPVVPKGWARCEGQLLPINQNQALFALLGTMYGGDGRTTFALPNLSNRIPVHHGAGLNQGQAPGQARVTLTPGQMPAHVHRLQVSATDADLRAPAGNRLARANNFYAEPGVAATTLSPATVGDAGGGQSHENVQPVLDLNWCIALQGIFPSPN